MTASAPMALSIAGSDSGGGAGIQADLRAFGALGVRGATVITALTAQNPGAVLGVSEVPPAFVALQFRAVMDAMPVTAIKTGMLASARLVDAVSELLGRARASRPELRVVVDPVMVATSGARLLESDARRSVLARLAPLADVLTPNLHEAAVLLGLDAREGPAWSREERGEAARTLLRCGARAVLVKGGHGSEPLAADALATASGLTWLEAPRVAASSTHGTGCMLSAAIAAGLARGWPVERAARTAKIFLTEALRRGLDVPLLPFDAEDAGDER